MKKLTGQFTTPNAQKYIAQLCKHFAHKVEVEIGENTGRADLPTGQARMMAQGDQLVIEMDLNDPELADRAKYIIDSHLERFAFREAFTSMNWGPVSEA